MLKELKEVLIEDFWIMPATPKYISEGIPYITSKNIKNGKIDFENVNYINAEDYKKISKNRPILIDDILISMIGTLGEIAIVKESDGMFYGQNMFLVRLDKNKIHQRYFVNYFKSDVVKRQLINKQNKSTQSYLKANHIESLKIPIPDLQEQKRIAYKLDKIKDIIDMRKKQIEELDQLIKSLFVDMFGTPFINEKGWDKGIIKNLILEAKYGTSRPAVNGGKYKYLRMNNITYDGKLDISNIKYIDIPDNQLEKCTTQLGDVLFNRTNSRELVGKTCVYDLDEKMVIAGFVIRVRTNKRANPYFLSTYLNTKYLKDKMFNMCKNASGQSNINAQELQNIEIYIPPIELQNQFAEFVKLIDKQKFEIQKSLEEIQKLQESLMNKYFGG